jgi:hypothetical protein
MGDIPDRPPRFWTTWLPWRILGAIAYVAFVIFVVVVFWVKKTSIWDWCWFLGVFGSSAAYYVLRAVHEVRLLRRIQHDSQTQQAVDTPEHRRAVSGDPPGAPRTGCAPVGRADQARAD